MHNSTSSASSAVPLRAMRLDERGVLRGHHREAPFPRAEHQLARSPASSPGLAFGQSRMGTCRTCVEPSNRSSGFANVDQFVVAPILRTAKRRSKFDNVALVTPRRNGTFFSFLFFCYVGASSLVYTLHFYHLPYSYCPERALLLRNNAGFA